ncbi:BA75_02563T0 [Komagataella pastoris]|uniref:BA75_02563T0 n=1 Tax=Komagataella pastoris TaxID=4922 RepID=A0A1B2JCB9_PICPA|nr:BA75_02563T0 [Komagataella pastoris]
MSKEEEKTTLNTSDNDSIYETDPEDVQAPGNPISTLDTATGFSLIDDTNPQEIAADEDLADELASDLEYLDLVHLKVKSLENLNLDRFAQLTGICLRQNLVDSLVPLKAISRKDQVTELDFYDNRINHISKHVNEFENLEVLDLSFNKIKNIKNVDRLTKLKKLYLVQNKVHEIKNISNLKSLETLELGGNKLTEIGEELLHLSSITDLWLGKNYIQRLQNLDSLKNLEILSIQSNRLTKIEGLEELVNLRELYLADNGISKIENLDKNTKLEVLDLTSNRIEHLENMSHLTSLTDLWFSYNKISSFAEVEKELSKLPQLDTVYFEHNPIQTENPTSYRRKLKLILGSSLQKIDATYIRS